MTRLIVVRVEGFPHAAKDSDIAVFTMSALESWGAVSIVDPMFNSLRVESVQIGSTIFTNEPDWEKSNAKR